MEKININNYPVWITDYHDGTLTGDQMEELFIFLSEHPELMEELEQYDPAPLHPDLYDRQDKKVLKRDFGELTLIQQEELTAALAEGDLTDREAEEILSHVESSPHLTELYHSLKDIRLIPENISFPGKRSLKRYPLRPQFNRAMVTLLTAAASIAILFSISVLFDRNKPLSAPFTGSAGIDPVITADKEHNPGNSTAENIQQVAEDTRFSENRDNNTTERITGGKAEETEERSINNPAINSAAEYRSSGISTGEEEDVNSESGREGETSDLLAADVEITAPIKEPYLPQENGTTSAAENNTERENSDHILVPEQTRESISLPYIEHPSTPSIKDVNHTPVTLAEMTPLPLPEENDPGSPREFIAKSFRQLILNDKNASTERVKPIELADATVTGINKLLGWEMKLEKKSDESGTLNSISFASQLIKFDHNIKNSSN
jgi:hypothetical protein